MSLEKLRLHRAQTDAAFLAGVLVDPDVEGKLLSDREAMRKVSYVLKEALHQVELVLSAEAQRSGATDGAVDPAKQGGKQAEQGRKPSRLSGATLPIKDGPFAGLRYLCKVTCEGCGRRAQVAEALKETPPWSLADLCGACTQAAEPDPAPAVVRRSPPILSATALETDRCLELMDQYARGQGIKPTEVVQVSPNGVKVVAHAYQTAKQGGEELEVPHYPDVGPPDRTGPLYKHPKLEPKNNWRAKKAAEAVRKC